MGSLLSTCDSEVLQEKDSANLQLQRKLSQIDCKLGGSSLLATSEKNLCKSTNNYSNLVANYPSVNKSLQPQVINTIPAAPRPQISSYQAQSNTNTIVKSSLYQSGGCNTTPAVSRPQVSSYQAKSNTKTIATSSSYQSRGCMQYWLDGDSYDNGIYECTYSNSSPKISKSIKNNAKKNNILSKPAYNKSQKSSIPYQKDNKKGVKKTQKYISSFSDSSSDEEYSEFETFIVSYNPSHPKTKPIVIPNSFQNEDIYINHFKHAFYIELDAILEQALGEAFLSNNYSLNLGIDKNSAYISERGPEEIVFESEIRMNDIVLIIPDQKQIPKSFDELKERKIFWTLGLINKEKNNQVRISLNPNRKSLFKSSRKYIVTSIGNITSLKRELSVLEDIEDLSLGSIILNPQANIPVSVKYVPQRFIETINNKNYNKSQVKAIKNSINADGKITLIQGPPGTGKTTTVVGILSGLFALNRDIKVLICAQSNSAVDEIASTVLKKGIFDINGKKRDDISLLRIGEKKKTHELGIEEEEKTAEEIEVSVHSIKLSVKLENSLREKDPTPEIEKITKKLGEMSKQIEELKMNYQYDALRSAMGEQDRLSNELGKLQKKKNSYFSKKNKLKSEIIKNSDIIFCTSSKSDSAEVSKNIESVDYLIIDEACQSLELSTLIPFIYDPKSVILIGDPKQLPATTFSEKSKINKYDRSLFERMMQCNVKPILLSEQYRMMQEISDFTSKTFYQNQIQTGSSIRNRPIPDWVYPAGLYFFGVTKSKEKLAKGSMSYYNDPEAQFALALYDLLINKIGNSDAHIGIISPYKGQVQHIEKLLYKRYGNSWKKNCEVSSVDGFQGREVDIVIFSAVRSENIGFLKDERRMNVAISRAKYGMYTIGNEACLARNPKWKSLIDYCKEIKKYRSCNSFNKVQNIFNNQ